MIIFKQTDLLEENKLQSIGHFCNCFHTMGAGLALKIKTKYPEAFLADKITKYGDLDKLGTFSYATSTTERKLILNLYTQFRYGRDKKYTNYESVYNSLISAKKLLIDNNIGNFGLPYKAGCMLGGGNWDVVLAIIKEIFEKEKIEVWICSPNGFDHEN